METSLRQTGFSAEEVTGLLVGGVPPREVRRLLAAHTSHAAWSTSGDGDPRWVALPPVDPGSPAVVLGSPGYPAFLLGSPSPPPVLFYEGEIKACRLGVGVVGSRAMSTLGSTVADVAVAAALSVDAPVLSGLARGVDEYAHRRTLSSGGVCVGFAGAALDRLSTREGDLLSDIISAGGVVFSECLPGVGASAGSLLARNRLIAAGSCPLVPCEALLPSGTTACVAAAIRAGAPVVVPMPRAGHRGGPGARGLLALAGAGDVSTLNWPKNLLERHRERVLVNAVAHTREDLDLYIRVLFMFGRA